MGKIGASAHWPRVDECQPSWEVYVETIGQLEKKLAEPSEALERDIAGLEGDILVLGVGGKVGPGVARQARNAIDRARLDKRVIGVARFTDQALAEELQRDGIETIAADLTDDEQLRGLPDVENVIYMPGMKFGTTGNEHYTWMMNAYLPGRVAERFRNSRIVAFSTLLVYPLAPVRFGGSTERQPPGPIGEYAQSCLGRERMFEHFSRKYGTPVVLFRLGYAIETRYGVLLEIAQAVKKGEPIDLRIGHTSVIWQGDASELALRSLNVCDSPPRVVNIAGPELVSIRWLAERFGERFGTAPAFSHEQSETAFVINGSRAHELFGYPNVNLPEMIDWVTQWVEAGGETIGKPTHFQEREGRF
jgi:nucleoside-diphosphate-sugar epimerase